MRFNLMNKLFQSSLLMLGVLAGSTPALAASSALWQAGRVEIRGTCPGTLVSIQSIHVAQDVGCSSGQYSYLAEPGELAVGELVRIDFEDFTFIELVVPPVPTATPAMTEAARPFLGGLLVAMGYLTRRLRRGSGR